MERVKKDIKQRTFLSTDLFTAATPNHRHVAFVPVPCAQFISKKQFVRNRTGDIDETTAIP